MGILRTTEGLLLKMKTIFLIIVIPACFWRESRLPFPSDGSPPTSCGDDRCRSFPTVVIGNPGCLSFGWIPATNCGYDGRGDGSPPTTCGDDRGEWSCPTLFIGNPSWVCTDGYPPQTAGMTEGEMDPCRLLAGMTFGGPMLSTQFYVHLTMSVR
jgi:hypothetical protein